MEKVFILSKDELKDLLDFIEDKIKKRVIILLRGDLGSGKTTLVQEFVKRKGSSATSPTFSIQQIYGEDIFHYDLYGVGLEKFLELGLFDEFEKDGIHFVEWGDEKLENLLKIAGFDYMVINIEPKNSKRVYKVVNA